LIDCSLPVYLIERVDQTGSSGVHCGSDT